VQSASHAKGVAASPIVLEVLDQLGEWTHVDALATAMGVPSLALDLLLEGLSAHGLVETESSHVVPADGVADDSPWRDWSPAAYLFHLATRDVRFGPRPSAHQAPQAPRPPVELPPRGETHLTLPAPQLPNASLRAALRDRRTHRRFATGALTLEDVGTLLGVTFGVQAWAHAEEGPLALKTSPSGGARHSLEAYVWARNVDQVPAGLYHYRPAVHALTRIPDGRTPETVTSWLPTQSGYEDAGMLVVVASELARVAWRYRSARAYRVVLIEAGHLGQTFCLVATALGLAPFCTAALADTAIESDLGLDGRIQPAMYLVGAGRVAPGPWQPHAGRTAPRVDVTDLGRALEAPLTRRSIGPRRPPRRARER
jgi:SagB-type dehydrogenase family enzyme